MAKRALCVGINDYPYGSATDLKGCVNDAHAWAQMLRDHFDFAAGDIRVITDAEATKAGMLAALGDLLVGATAGDVLVFTNSSHGSYIAETGGDEATYDEIICPHDIADNALVDDDLRELFVDLAEGVRLTVISDSCFSGTVTRAPGDANYERRRRFLNPALRRDFVVDNPWRAREKWQSKITEDMMKEVLISGCSDREYSYDARIGGEYHGAMTFYAQQAIREADYCITYEALGQRLAELLGGAGFNQHPQIEGRAQNKGRQVFA